MNNTLAAIQTELLSEANSLEDYGDERRKRTILTLRTVLKNPHPMTTEREMEEAKLFLQNARTLIDGLMRKTIPCPMEFEDTDPNCEVPETLKI